jgi:hypothetical protein
MAPTVQFLRSRSDCVPFTYELGEFEALLTNVKGKDYQVSEKSMTGGNYFRFGDWLSCVFSEFVDLNVVANICCPVLESPKGHILVRTMIPVACVRMFEGLTNGLPIFR